MAGLPNRATEAILVGNAGECDQETLNRILTEGRGGKKLYGVGGGEEVKKTQRLGRRDGIRRGRRNCTGGEKKKIQPRRRWGQRSGAGKTGADFRYLLVVGWFHNIKAPRLGGSLALGSTGTVRHPDVQQPPLHYITFNITILGSLRRSSVG